MTKKVKLNEEVLDFLGEYIDKLPTVSLDDIPDDGDEKGGDR